MQTSDKELKHKTKLFGASQAEVCATTPTTTTSPLTSDDRDLKTSVYLTNNAWMYTKQNQMISNVNSISKKNNSISDSSTADSDSGYMDDTRYESENEFFPVDLELSNCASAGSNKRVLTGYAGRAKNSDLAPSICENTRRLTINYGDDVGFICNKDLNEAEFMPHELSAESEQLLGCTDPAKLINKYYFGLADGVSANRLRGYDAKLFPNALIGACAELSDQSAEYLTNYAISHQASVMDEKLKSEESKAQNEISANIEQVASILKDYKVTNNRYNEGEDGEYYEVDEYYEEEEEDDEENESVDNEEYEYSTYQQQESELNALGVENESDCERLKVLLSKAHQVAESKRVYGSSTVVMLSLEFYDTSEYSLLSSCNVGDSGYMLIRDKKVLFKSQSQSHRYNAPYQLGCTPPELEEHHLYRDKAEDSICHSHLVKSGDFLIISSDGMFDNLYEDEIALIIDQSINSNRFADSPSRIITDELLSSICQVLVNKASKAGIKKDDMLVMLIYID